MIMKLLRKINKTLINNNIKMKDPKDHLLFMLLNQSNKAQKYN